MKIIKYNYNNLKYKKLDKIKTRVKIFLINDQDDILLVNSDGGFQLPGGHVEKGEDKIKALIREIKEETGISLLKKEIKKPFLEIRHYNENYKNTKENILSNIFYYYSKTNKKVNLDKIELTDTEIKNNFKITKIKKFNFKNFIQSYVENSNKEINKIIAKEIIFAFSELEKII